MFKIFFQSFLLSPPWALLYPASEPTFLEDRPPRVCLDFPQNQNPGPRPRASPSNSTWFLSLGTWFLSLGIRENHLEG